VRCLLSLAPALRPRESEVRLERLEGIEVTAFETFNASELKECMLEVAMLAVILLWSGRSDLM